MLKIMTRKPSGRRNSYYKRQRSCFFRSHYGKIEGKCAHSFFMSELCELGLERSEKKSPARKKKLLKIKIKVSLYQIIMI